MSTDLHKAKRIMIYGFSSTGKSTLADRLGSLLDLPVTHLDQLHFHPNTNWEPVEWDVFVKRHDEAVAQDRWIIEGSYSKLMANRAERADLIIHLDMNRFGCLFRFVRRWWHHRQGHTARVGTPDGLREKFNWDMVWWILEPRSLSPRRRKSHLIQKQSLMLNKGKTITLNTFEETNRLIEDLLPKSGQ